jgi:two-component system sensor histidine kinase MprB
MSLRTRWAVTLAVITALAVGLALAFSIVLIGNQLRRQVDADLSDRVAAIPRSLRDFLSDSPPRSDGRRPVDFDAVIQLVTPDGAPIGFPSDPVLPIDDATTRLAAGRGPNAIRTVSVDGVSYRMITSHIGGPNREGAVQIAIDISDIDRALIALRRRLAVLWLAASAAAALTGWLAARGAVKPIEQLTAAAEHVAETERLDVALNSDAPAEIGRLATSFSSMLGSLERSRRQQQQLVSDAGHELRTPLTALRTNLETLRRRSAELSEPQRDELLDAAITEVGELSTLSAELVDLASDSRRSEEAEDDLDLRALVETVADRFRHRVAQPIEVSGKGATVIGRRSQLERAVSNLIDNAQKWSPADSAIQISVEGTRVVVRDHGPGIPEADLPHVFDRFYRAVGARTTPGSGLGLAIVKAIVEGHGGRTIVGNDPDGGAQVGFEL